MGWVVYSCLVEDYGFVGVDFWRIGVSGIALLTYCRQFWFNE